MRRVASSLPKFLFLLAACAPSAPDGPALSAADSSSIRALQSAYVAAWLRDDTAGVLATLDAQGTLLPPRQLPIAGHAAMRDYWWPQDGSRTTITAFEWTIDELAGRPPFAYSRGFSTIAWTYSKDTVRQESTGRSPNLTLFRRQSDGSWKITHQMWGPPLP